MKIEKFKVLLYLKKSGMDKNGKAPIMGRITVNRTMAQFSCKLSCTPSLWNPRASRLEGKSKEAVETNKDIEQLLLSIQKAFDVLVEKKTDFEAKDVKEALQGSVKTQTTLLSFVDEHISELSTHEGIDMSKSSVWTYRKIRKNLAEFIGEKYRLTDLAFGQLTEPFISDFHHYLLDEKGFSSGTITIYVSLFKKMCRIALSLVISIWGNFTQWREYQDWEEADLKYRALKMVLPSDDPNVRYIEKFFSVCRDEKVIDDVKNRVAAYEDSVYHHYKMVKMAAIKDSIANSLFKEANEIKKKINKK